VYLAKRHNPRMIWDWNKDFWVETDPYTPEIEASTREALQEMGVELVMELEPIKQPHWRDITNPLSASIPETHEAVRDLVDRVNYLTDRLEEIMLRFESHKHLIAGDEETSSPEPDR
jgi:hypothetical protein